MFQHSGSQQGFGGGHLALSGDVFDCHDLCVGVLLPLSGCMPGILLNILQCLAQNASSAEAQKPYCREMVTCTEPVLFALWIN